MSEAVKETIPHSIRLVVELLFRKLSFSSSTKHCDVDRTDVYCGAKEACETDLVLRRRRRVHLHTTYRLFLDFLHRRRLLLFTSSSDTSTASFDAPLLRGEVLGPTHSLTPGAEQRSISKCHCHFVAAAVVA